MAQDNLLAKVDEKAKVLRLPADELRAARLAIRKRMTCPICGNSGHIARWYFDHDRDVWDFRIEKCNHEPLVELWRLLDATLNRD